MSLINPCIEPGCSTLCMGLFCVKHDAAPEREFPRGRPWPPLRAAQAVEVSAALAVAPKTVLTAVRPAA
jgi:hypothetical protein